MKKTPRAYARELYTAMVASPPHERKIVVRDFLNNLSRARKSSLRPRIMSAFSWLALAVEGRRSGIITTAKALTETERGHVKKIFNNTIFEECVDPKILGGAILQIEDNLIDGSVRTRLDDLKNKLVESK